MNQQPLNLSVHSLPDCNRVQIQAGRWKMFVLLLLCAAPVIASYVTYYLVRPSARTNYGQLINPQRSLPALVAQDLAGRSTSLQTLKGQWLLISVADAACQSDCQQRLYLQRQLRQALGVNQDRLDIVWMVTDQARISSNLPVALTQFTVLRVEPAQLAQWLKPSSGQHLQDHLYLVDPLGNWMMRFAAHMDLGGAMKAKRDLERLMRASKSWDQPGR